MAQKEVKSRIGSVKNIQKITRAMEMVAAARLRRAEQRIENLRPYANAIRRMTRRTVQAAYVDDKVDRVEMIYNGYISPLTQEVTTDVLLPLQDIGKLLGEGEEDD